MRVIQEIINQVCGVICSFEVYIPGIPHTSVCTQCSYIWYDRWCWLLHGALASSRIYAFHLFGTSQFRQYKGHIGRWVLSEGIATHVGLFQRDTCIHQDIDSWGSLGMGFVSIVWWNSCSMAFRHATKRGRFITKMAIRWIIGWTIWNTSQHLRTWPLVLQIQQEAEVQDPVHQSLYCGDQLGLIFGQQVHLFRKQQST